MFSLKRINGELHVVINLKDGTAQFVPYGEFWQDLDSFIQEIAGASDAVEAFARAGKESK